MVGRCESHQPTDISRWQMTDQSIKTRAELFNASRESDAVVTLSSTGVDKEIQDVHDKSYPDITMAVSSSTTADLNTPSYDDRQYIEVCCREDGTTLVTSLQNYSCSYNANHATAG